MYLSIIEIETRLFHQTTLLHVFGIKGCDRHTLHDISTRHHNMYHTKFKIAAIESSLKLSDIPQYVRRRLDPGVVLNV